MQTPQKICAQKQKITQIILKITCLKEIWELLFLKQTFIHILDISN